MNPNPYESPKTNPEFRAEPSILAALVGEDGGMSIDFEICRDDMVVFAQFHNRNSPVLRRQVRLALIAVTLIFMVLLAIVVSIAINAPEFWVIAVGIAIALVIVLPFFGRIQEWRPWSSARVCNRPPSSITAAAASRGVFTPAKVTLLSRE